MAKRIYQETMKKWALKAGIPVGVAGFALLFIYLNFLGVIDITGHSGDMACAGTIGDPCLAYINFTTKEDIFIYPVGYDPYGRNTPFETDKELESWKIYRSWGKYWREIKLNETCTGTWCGAPDNKGVKYSFVFRDGRDYQIKIYALKKDPTQDIKWGFGPVDPVWFGVIDVKNRIHINQLRKKDKIKSSNGKRGNDLRFESYNSLTKEILIEDEDDIIIKMRLTSPYVVFGLVASDDTKVAEFYLEDWKDGKINLVDTINFYDINDDYKPIDRDFRFKWENITRKCVKENASAEICFEEYNWVEFEFLDELPHKNIKISLWANTEVTEEIEWVPTLEGFEIFQWAAWNISDTAFVQSLDISFNTTSAAGLFFKSDGTEMYVSEITPGIILHYNLSEAWNVTSTNGSHPIESVLVTAAHPEGIFFRPNGREFFFPDSDVNNVTQYSLTTAWNLSTATLNQSLDTTGDGTVPQGLFFKDDGTKMYTSTFNDGLVHEYALSTAWDISTAIDSNSDLDVSGKVGNSQGLHISSDGLNVYVSDGGADIVYQYNLSVAWDVSTGSYSGNSLDISGQDSSLREMFSKTDGSKFYTTGFAADLILEYNISVIIDILNPNVTINQPLNQTYTTKTINFNVTALDDIGMDDCNYTLTSGLINYTMSNVPTSPTQWTAINSTMSEGGHQVFYHCWDTSDNLNNTKNVSFFIDSLSPDINITYPINNTNWTNVNLDVNFTRSDISLESCWYSNDTYSVNSTPDTGCNNITSIVWSLGQHNVTVWANDTFGNENYSRVSFSIFKVEENISLKEVELGSNINITANTTLGIICVDIDHPDYGINYSCSSDVNVAFNISFFRKTTLSNGSSFIILENADGFNVSNFSILSHQYDEVDTLTINISGENRARDVTFYKANTTNFDRAYNGILVGKYIFLQNFTDGEDKSNFSFTTANTEVTKYFYLDDKILDNGFLNITMNISGFEYGFDFLDNFDNYSKIDRDVTTMHLDQSGVIMMVNSSKAFFIYDDYDSSFGNQWIAVPGTNAPTTETNAYIQTDANVPSGQDGTFSSRIYTNHSTNGLSLYTTDRIEFRIESIYDGTEDADSFADGKSRVYLSNTKIWESSYIEGFTSPGYGAAEESDANLTFILEKVNRTTWSVNISGWETSFVDADECNAAATLVFNWTTKSAVINSAHPDCTHNFALNSSVYQTVNYSYSYPIFIESIASAGATNDPFVDNVYTRMYPLNRSLWYRNNGSVTSKSIYDSSTAIKSATFSVGAAIGSQVGEVVYWYLSADDGINWEGVTDGVEHTFSASGQHLKWRINFSSENIGYLNSTEALNLANISIERGNPENITFDFGDDDIIDYTIMGEFNVTNGTFQISLGSADVSNSFTNLRTLYDHTYEIPLVVSSASVGTVQIDAINITYNPNPVSLNITAIQNFVSNKTGRTNFSIDVGSYPGNITINDIRFDYAGGNDTINITIHSPNYIDYVNQTNITLWYSRWDYNFVPRFVEYLEFLPKNPTSRNVSAYGQSSNETFGAIFNLTNLGYGGRDANLSIYLNDTLSCVNLTMSLNNSKTDGFLINDSWTNIQELSYLTTLDLWMWADYGCNYSSWRLFNPFIYFRQCCENCTCSEGLD